MASYASHLLLLLLSTLPSLLTTSEVRGGHPRLVQVQAMCRHGHMTPPATYPTDPHAEVAWAGGRGQLLPAGVQQEYRIGVLLRQLYPGLAPTESCDGLMALASSPKRHPDSVQAKLLGLFANTSHGRDVNYEEGPLPDQPPLCPIELSLFEDSCPALSQGRLDFLQQQRFYQEFVPALKQAVRDHAGIPEPGEEELATVYVTLKTQERAGLQLPAWTSRPLLPGGTSTFFQALVKFWRLRLSVAQDPNLRLNSAGPMMKTLLDNMRSASTGRQSGPSMVLITPFGTLFAAVEAALGTYERPPPDSECLLWELHATWGGRHLVRLLRRHGSTAATEELDLGCSRESKLCPLEQLARLPWVPRTLDEVRAACQVQ